VVDDVTVRGDPLLAPFAEGIRAGADLVMVAIATYRRIDPDNRAVFSRTVIQGMLRGDLGYDGVVITDDVGAAAEVASVPAGNGPPGSWRPAGTSSSPPGPHSPRP
jgi:beta-N-acetylhexosaminidase